MVNHHIRLRSITQVSLDTKVSIHLISHQVLRRKKMES